MRARQTSSGCEWSGMTIIARLQVAAGALDLDEPPSADPALRALADAVQAVPWADVPFLELVVARSVIARFLCEVASRQCLEVLPATIVLRLEAAPAEHFNAAVADAIRRVLAGENVATAGRVDERVAAALQLIRSHCERKVRIDDLAHAVGLSRWHLERLTKRNTGTSPRQHLVAARMERTMALLKEGRFSIKELAVRVGYGNANAFTRDFRRCYGAPPSTWLRVHHRRAASPVQIKQRG
jgi:AraC-like DNA-binding protein